MSKAKRTPQHLDRCSVYVGREMQGRYVQLARDRFQAFDAAGRSLGIRRSRDKALVAIDRAKAK